MASTGLPGRTEDNEQTSILSLTFHMDDSDDGNGP
jgi:hypothetical protein